MLFPAEQGFKLVTFHWAPFVLQGNYHHESSFQQSIYDVFLVSFTVKKKMVVSA